MKITDKNGALIAVKKNSFALEYVNNRLQDDPEIVKIAVEKNGEALKFASDRLRDDIELRKLANN
jgi:hypothetical protein